LAECNIIGLHIVNKFVHGAVILCVDKEIVFLDKDDHIGAEKEAQVKC
jgi:hypothetical protein